MVYSIVNTSKQLFYETFRTNRNLRIAKQSCKSVERDACGGKQMGEAGLYPAREAVARLSYCERLEAALMPLQALINIKAPRRGLDGARGKPYSRICRRGPVTIADGELVVKFHSTSQLGNSGRGNHAQNFLKFRPGRWASERAAYSREARTTHGIP